MIDLKHHIWQIFSEDDDAALDVAKIMAGIAFISYLGYAGYGLYHDHFALNEFANGLMQVLIGSGAIVAGKQLTSK